MFLVTPPNDEVNGTGPFMLGKQDSDTIILKRNSKYFKGTPRSQELIFRIYENQHQVWRAFLEGNIDFASNMILEDFKNLRTNTSFPCIILSLITIRIHCSVPEKFDLLLIMQLIRRS